MTLDLFRRLPRLRYRPGHAPAIAMQERDRYPALAADLAVLDQHVAPAFARHDRQALLCQNRYRLLQLTKLAAATLLAGLGGLQAVWPRHRWPGLVLAVLSILLATVTSLYRDNDPLAQFLTARVKAERLRALHFRFLARTGPYAGPDRVGALRRAVRAVEAGREPR